MTESTVPNTLHAEVAVLGGGPGGYTAAFRAADLGKKVVLIERYPVIGGVCLNVGCIPSKALLHAAQVIHDAAESAPFGISFPQPQIDLEKLREWKGKVVKTLNTGLAGLAKQRQVTVVHGTARFTSDRAFQVETAAGVQTVSFDHAIIAAGSQPVKIPGFPYDDPRLIDSTGALELADVPERLLIVGGGIIGLVMACVYHALGSKLTVVELMDQLIPGCDPDLVKPLAQRLQKQYEKILLKTKVARIESEADGLRVLFEGEGAPESELFDRVLVAVGRSGNGAAIGAALWALRETT